MNALELLESLNSLDEHERIEAKRASEVGKALLETICAFSNEPGLGGGWLLLGAVSDEQSLFPAYTVEGIPDPDKVSADLATQCRDMFNIPIRVGITAELVSGKTVIVVTVPEAQPHEKPVFLKATGLPRGAFRRIGSTDQRCVDDDLVVLYHGRGHESFDAGIVADATLEDLSPEAIADYRTARAESNPDAEELQWDDTELLRALGCLKRAGRDVGGPGEEWKPTVAGLILFGRTQALRRCFPMTRVDYIRVPGREWVRDPDRRFDTIELRGPLFRLIRRAQAAILDDLPRSFRLAEGELQRSEPPLIPQRVIREALVNALMHRNYRTNGPVQIIRYADRLEIRNPGFSLKPQEHLGEPGSETRNPTIAAVLHETRFAETKGSGIRVMRDLMENAGLTPPLFESDRGRDEFVARYLFHHFLGDQDIAWLARFKDLHLTDDDMKALVFLRENGFIDNAFYRYLTNVDTLTASGALRRLRDYRLVRQLGRSSGTYYVPTPLLLGETAPGAEATALLSDEFVPRESDSEAASHESFSGNLDPLSSNPGPVSGKLEPLSGKLAPLSGKLEPLSGKLEPLSADSGAPDAPAGRPDHKAAARRDLLDELPGELAARVGGLGQRRPPHEVQEVIFDVCRLRPRRAEELALLLLRSVKHVREHYLRPMVSDGRLVMTVPNEPNNPNQAYRAAERGTR